MSCPTVINEAFWYEIYKAIQRHQFWTIDKFLNFLPLILRVGNSMLPQYSWVSSFIFNEYVRGTSFFTKVYT